MRAAERRRSVSLRRLPPHVVRHCFAGQCLPPTHTHTGSPGQELQNGAGLWGHMRSAGRKHAAPVHPNRFHPLQLFHSKRRFKVLLTNLCRGAAQVLWPAAAPSTIARLPWCLKRAAKPPPLLAGTLPGRQQITALPSGHPRNVQQLRRPPACLLCRACTFVGRCAPTRTSCTWARPTPS